MKFLFILLAVVFAVVEVLEALPMDNMGSHTSGNMGMGMMGGMKRMALRNGGPRVRRQYNPIPHNFGIPPLG
uniref:Uncharacterized protein n=1 Tax=Ditylenchus dipsaci TaxID=166011 RepID=A0A915D4C7_9BILA